MKKIIIAACVLMFSIPAFSQQNADYAYSIGVRGFNYMQMPKILNQSNSDNYLKTYFNSVLLKFNDNLFSYRINGSYLRKDDEFFNNCENCELVRGQMKDYAFKLGFEKNFSYTAIQPYIALDLGYRSNRFKGTSVTVNPAKLSQTTPASQAIPANQVTATKEGFTISPVLGIKFNPIKEISIFAESNLEFFYSYERQETITQDASNTRSLSKFHKGEYLINPVSIGIQIHLVNKN